MAELADLPAGRQARTTLAMFYTYAIRSIKRTYIYVGLTNNYVRRIKQHNNGKEITTRPYAPFVTIIVEEYTTRFDARQREKYLKSGIGKEYLKKLK